VVIFIVPIVSVLVFVVVYGIADHAKRKRQMEALQELQRIKQREADRKFEQRLAEQSKKDWERERHNAFVTKQRRLLNDSLRYDILRRDGFRCQICGATAKDGYKLHVDHIVPVSKGGLTEPSNLRTLCERCNMGKGAKIE